MARMQRSLFTQLNALAEEISQGAEKAAAAKSAAPVPADPGGYSGASAHPSTHVDNNVQRSTTGSRASEYESDIKKQQGALGVDSTPELSYEGRQDDVQLNINTNASAVGEDPAVEDDYKGDKDDAPTTLPSAPQDAEKYSSVTFKQAHAQCGQLGNEILADLITAKSAEVGRPTQRPAAKQAAAADASYAAGYELAAALGADKTAAEAAVRDVCANTLREADEMADLFIGFYRTKASMDEMPPGEEAMPAEGEGEAPAGGEADLAAMLGGAGGEMPPGPEAGLEGAPPSEDEALQELAMALQELGISPEALLEGLSGAGAGGPAGAGMPPEGMPPEGMPPELAPKMAAAQELNAIGRAVGNYQRSGNFQIKEARTKRSRHLRDIMKAHVYELVSR